MIPARWDVHFLVVHMYGERKRRRHTYIYIYIFMYRYAYMYTYMYMYGVFRASAHSYIKNGHAFILILFTHWSLIRPFVY